jgi:hypothetical protein
MLYLRSFQTSLAATQAFQDGSTLLQSTTQNSRRIASARRTYNWQAEELVISFNMTNIANPSCTRLQPPLKWLASSGAKLKVLHECSDTGEITQESKCSKVEVSVSRKFAESSLNTLRNYGFGREDIYRMLDKGPWTLVFDISTALPRLFANLQVKRNADSMIPADNKHNNYMIMSLTLYNDPRRMI